jgi:hypothetical protein
MEEWEYRNAINFSNSHPGFGENDKIPGDPKNNKPDKNEKPSKEAIEAEHRPIPINDGLS